MIKNSKKWLERETKEWVSKGWISAEAEKHICQAYRPSHDTSMGISIYSILAVVGFSIIGMALIWGAAHVWYQISTVIRTILAVLLLILSQLGVGMAMFQERQGTLPGEAVAVIHSMIVFVVMAMAEQTFYIGWDTADYIAASAVLTLPAVYLLRSVGGLAVYCLSVLVWAAVGGPLNAAGGTAFLWLMIILPLPFYLVLDQNHDELRLSIFSWMMTVTVFAAFGLAARDTDYIPFLMMAALAVVIMLSGYTIDIRKAWGVPFRWFGRFVAAGSLLISCMPFSWHGVADIQGFHWTTTLITIVLFFAIAALLAKGVKKRLWGPVVYTGIPVVLACETILVRNGLYSSVPLIVSSLYMLFLGFYETLQGFNTHRMNHTKFGILILASLVVSFLIGTSFSPLVPVVAIVVLVLVIVQLRRTSSSRKAAALRSERRSHLKHTSATVRGDRQKQRSEDTAPYVPLDESPLETKDAAEDADTLAEWMKQIHMPKPDTVSYTPPQHTDTVIPKEKPQSLFVAPVFHDPDEMALPTAPQPRMQTRKIPDAPKEAKPMTSPWQSDKQAPVKPKRHFSRSPWAKEGETRK